MVQKVVVENPQAADLWLLEHVQAIANQAVAARGRFCLALSGGSSPLNFYRLLAGLSLENFPWDKTRVWMVDERFVPYGHKDHNGAIIKGLLCGTPGIPGPLAGGAIHLIDTSLSDPSASAIAYAHELSENFAEEEWPKFDFMLLGMGGDGHTASIFPGTGAVDVIDKKTLTCTPHTAPHQRVSLSLPVLNAALDSVFLVCGESKVEMLARILAGKNPDLPASLVDPIQGTVRFLCDSFSR